MNIPIVAAEIARRIPEMAKDSPINNATVIENIIADQMAQTERQCVWKEGILDDDWKTACGGAIPKFTRVYLYTFCPKCGGRIVI